MSQAQVLTPEYHGQREEEIMDDAKVESQVKSAMDGDVLGGETMVLSKDEQHLANLGYKQGAHFSFGRRISRPLT